MGSGRGDRNQPPSQLAATRLASSLQWGPVVVTGISWPDDPATALYREMLQWGPVVVTGIRARR